MKKLALIFMLVGFVALGSVMAKPSDYRINDPPGIECLGDVIDQSQSFPVIVDQVTIQVFGFIRLPAIDDWPKSGEMLDNNSKAFIYNYNSYAVNAQSIATILQNMTIIQKEKDRTRRENVKWIKGYSMAY